MKILAMSTAEQCCSLAVADGSVLVFEEFWDIKKTHARRAMGMIENAFEHRVDFPLSCIDMFVAARGPGSFTGLRIGISIIQALSYSQGKKAYGVSSLDGIAYRFSDSNQPVCVMMDAKRKEVYTAVFRFEKGCLVQKTEEMVMSPEVVVNGAPRGALFVGTGALVYRKMIEGAKKDSQICGALVPSVSAAAMIRATREGKDFCSNPGNILAPSYIRKSDAQIQFQES